MHLLTSIIIWSKLTRFYTDILTNTNQCLNEYAKILSRSKVKFLATTSRFPSNDYELTSSKRRSPSCHGDVTVYRDNTKWFIRVCYFVINWAAFSVTFKWAPSQSKTDASKIKKQTTVMQLYVGNRILRPDAKFLLALDINSYRPSVP